MIFDVDDIYEIEEGYKTKLKEKQQEIERLNNNIKEVLEYLDISNMSFVDKNEIAIRLKGSDKE